MTLVSTKRALEFFEAKMEFTTGPVELSGMMERDENINIIDVRLPEDFAKGHIPGAVSLPKDNWDTFSGLSRDKTNIIYCYSQVCHRCWSVTSLGLESPVVRSLVAGRPVSTTGAGCGS